MQGCAYSSFGDIVTVCQSLSANECFGRSVEQIRLKSRNRFPGILPESTIDFGFAAAVCVNQWTLRCRKRGIPSCVSAINGLLQSMEN